MATIEMVGGNGANFDFQRSVKIPFDREAALARARNEMLLPGMQQEAGQRQSLWEATKLWEAKAAERAYQQSLTGQNRDFDLNKMRQQQAHEQRLAAMKQQPVSEFVSAYSKRQSQPQGGNLADILKQYQGMNQGQGGMQQNWATIADILGRR